MEFLAPSLLVVLPPVSYHNLIVRNFQKDLSATTTVMGTLTLQDCRLYTYYHKLVMGTGASFDTPSAFDATNCIVSNAWDVGNTLHGVEQKLTSNILTPVLYPLGSYQGTLANVTYAPVTIQELQGTYVADASFRLVHTTLTGIANNFVGRAFFITSTGISAVTAFRPIFQFLPTDIIYGSPSQVQVAGLSGIPTAVGTGFVNANSFGNNSVGNTLLNGIWSAQSPVVYTYYRNKSSDVWSNVLNWEASTDFATWVQAPNYPGQVLATDVVSISGGTVTLDIPVTIGALSISGSLDITALQLTVQSTTSINAGGALSGSAGSGWIQNGLVSNAGNVSIAAGSTAEFHSGLANTSTFQHGGNAIFRTRNKTIQSSNALTLQDIQIDGAITLTGNAALVGSGLSTSNIQSNNLDAYFLNSGRLTYQGTEEPMQNGVFDSSPLSSEFFVAASFNTLLSDDKPYQRLVAQSGSVVTISGTISTYNIWCTSGASLVFDPGIVSVLSTSGSVQGVQTVDMSGGGLPHVWYVSALSFSTSVGQNLIPGVGKVVYNGVGTQDIQEFVYYDLESQNGVKSTSSNLILNQLHIQSGSTLLGTSITAGNQWDANHLIVNGILDFGNGVARNCVVRNNFDGIGIIRGKNALSHTFELAAPTNNYIGTLDMDTPSFFVYSSSISPQNTLNSLAISYPNLRLKNTSQKIMINENHLVKGNLYVETGSVLSPSSASVGHVLSVGGTSYIDGEIQWSGTGGQRMSFGDNITVTGKIESAFGAVGNIYFNGALNTLLGAGILNIDNGDFKFHYARNGDQVIFNAGHPSLVAEGTGVKSLSTSIGVYNLSILSGVTLNSGRFQITGNASKQLLMESNASLLLGDISSGTYVDFPLNYTQANIQLDPTSTVTYQYASDGVISPIPVYGNLFTDGSGTIKRVDGNTKVQGNLWVKSGHLDFMNSVIQFEVYGNTTVNGVLPS